MGIILRVLKYSPLIARSLLVEFGATKYFGEAGDSNQVRVRANMQVSDRELVQVDGNTVDVVKARHCVGNLQCHCTS